MLNSRVDVLLIGKPLPFRGDGETSTIGARIAATGPVKLTTLGFAGDQVADPSVHGGPDKAVHFYPAEHYPAWRADFAKGGLEPHPLLEQFGGFGENLTGSGLAEDKVQIGDRFRIGTAIVEISQGRQPCWKIDHHFGMKGMTAAVIRTGRGGFYFRVIEEGEIAFGDTIEQVHRLPHSWTVERTFQLLIGGMHKAEGAIESLSELAELEVLAESWRQRANMLLTSLKG